MSKYCWVKEPRRKPAWDPLGCQQAYNIGAAIKRKQGKGESCQPQPESDGQAGGRDGGFQRRGRRIAALLYMIMRMSCNC